MDQFPFLLMTDVVKYDSDFFVFSYFLVNIVIEK